MYAINFKFVFVFLPLQTSLSENKFLEFKLLDFHNFYAGNPNELKNLYRVSFTTSSGNSFTKFEKKSFKELKNLLSTLEDANCICLVDNYLGFDVPAQITQPVILRQLAQVSLAVQTESGLSEESVLFPVKSSVKNESTSWKSPRPCVVSNDSLEISGCFYELVFLRYASKFKPWNCEVQFSLFYSEAMTSIPKGSTYPKIFRYAPVLNMYLTTIPSSVPPIHVSFVTELETLKSYRFPKTGILATTLTTSFRRGQQLSHELFYVSVISTKTLERYLVCIHCTRQNYAQINGNFLHDSLNIEGFPYGRKDYNQIQINVEELTRNDFNTHMLACTNNFTKSLLLHSDSSTESLLHAYMNIWMKILSNYTYPLVKGRCENGVLKRSRSSDYKSHKTWLREKTYTGDMPQQFGFFVENTVRSLEFIACGQPDTETLAYTELFHAFDQYTWMLVLIFSATIILVIKFFRVKSHTKFQQSLEYIVRIYLEQDIGELVCRNVFSMRFFICTFMIAVTILRNAWTTDVYNMVLPRKPVQIKTFEQLISKNFTIYSRAIENKNWWTDPAYKSEKRNTPHHVISPSFKDHLASEVHVLKYSTDSKEAVGNNLNDMVFNLTSLHPHKYFILELAMKLAIEFRRAAKKPWLVSVHRTAAKFFMEEEKKVLWQHLRDCNNSALVLPSHMSSHYAKKLHKEEIPNAHIHLGVEETYYPSFNGFYFMYNAPVWLIKRQKLISGTGILEWWSNYIRKTASLSDAIEESALITPTMSGNIFVIFVLFLSDLGVATVVLLVEMNKILLAPLKTYVTLLFAGFKFWVSKPISLDFNINVIAVKPKDVKDSLSQIFT